MKFGEVERLAKVRDQDSLADGIGRYVSLEHLEPSESRIGCIRISVQSSQLPLQRRLAALADVPSSANANLGCQTRHGQLCAAHLPFSRKSSWKAAYRSGEFTLPEVSAHDSPRLIHVFSVDPDLVQKGAASTSHVFCRHLMLPNQG